MTVESALRSTSPRSLRELRLILDNWRCYHVRDLLERAGLIELYSAFQQHVHGLTLESLTFISPLTPPNREVLLSELLQKAFPVFSWLTFGDIHTISWLHNGVLRFPQLCRHRGTLLANIFQNNGYHH